MSTYNKASVDNQAGRFGSASLVNSAHTFSPNNLRDKSVVITGAASGIGEASLRAFVKAGAYVTFLDQSDRGQAIEAEIGSDKVAFVRGDVSNWSDQRRLFQTAVERAPTKQVDIVFANAGVGSPSTVTLADPEEPIEPDLKQVSVNLNGCLYATKLALHYFRRRSAVLSSPGCLIFTSSVTGYTHSENGVRGLMRSLRVAIPESEMRVNILAPWFVRTRIVSEKIWDWYTKSSGALFCDVEDAATAVLHMACDESIHGRCLTVAPREVASRGYVDLDRDGYDVEHVLAGWYKSQQPKL
ncbi:5'-hydroxyaverantin dehydrogenase [Pseudocercospora fuligena]|uniref:5'-hydroxyaverantin dehydrogenase n=1 Tax=Pseudocercospora fuligena TaxID=685502 RepID=A0A8H6VEX6_9PEZI|nr:5'-hydroxyaverantin dehydrogenase [Pseudocercospora fuligena]